MTLGAGGGVDEFVGGTEREERRDGRRGGVDRHRFVRGGVAGDVGDDELLGDADGQHGDDERVERPGSDDVRRR